MMRAINVAVVLLLGAPALAADPFLIHERFPMTASQAVACANKPATRIGDAHHINALYLYEDGQDYTFLSQDADDETLLAYFESVTCLSDLHAQISIREASRSMTRFLSGAAQSLGFDYAPDGKSATAELRAMNKAAEALDARSKELGLVLVERGLADAVGAKVRVRREAIAALKKKHGL